MNLVDSSAWLEYLSDGQNANFFAPAIRDRKNLLVPATVLYKVFRVVLRERSEEDALLVVATLRQGEILDVTSDIVLLAAKLSVQHQLSMTNSVLYALTQQHRAILWTQDSAFEGLASVRYYPKW